MTELPDPAGMYDPPVAHPSGLDVYFEGWVGFIQGVAAVFIPLDLQILQRIFIHT